MAGRLSAEYAHHGRLADQRLYHTDLPIVLCAPKFLDGALTLGEVMQAASAFVLVQSALNWMVDNYPRLADWVASARRVATLDTALEELARAQAPHAGKIERGDHPLAALRLRDVSVLRTDGVALSQALSSRLCREKLLLTGASGTGKSTLVRALAGVWPWGRGRIEVRAGARLLVLPQRVYLPAGSLRRILCYPDAADNRSASEIAAALRKVDLGHLAAHLEEDAPWDRILSGGEKQRLAFARVFLMRPDIVVLDEATAALDPSSQDRLMKRLMHELKGSTVVSVGHRPGARRVPPPHRDAGARRLRCDACQRCPPVIIDPGGSGRNGKVWMLIHKRHAL